LPNGAEEGLGELPARGQPGWGAVHQHLATAEHVGAVGDGQRGPGPQLHDEHRGARLGQRPDVAGEQVGRYLGCQVGGRLVQQERGGLDHEHPAHGQHLPLAAAEPSGPAGQHLAEPREHPGHVLDPRADLAPVQQVPAHLQVLPDGERREDVVGLRHVADPGPGDLLRRQPGDIAVAGQDPARRRTTRRS
jgi:hypothetical protein